MKTKNFEKKLTLNKKTIANLNRGQLAQARGGGETTSCYTCDTCLTYCSCTCETCVPTGIDPTQDCNSGHKTCDTWICAVSDTCPELCS
jgi:hypothetical protein